VWLHTHACLYQEFLYYAMLYDFLKLISKTTRCISGSKVQQSANVSTTSSQTLTKLHTFLASHVHSLHKNNTIEGQTRAFSHHCLPQPVSFKRSLAVTGIFKIKFAAGNSSIAFKNWLLCPFKSWAEGLKIYAA